MGRRRAGFTTHEFSTALTALIVIAILAAVAVMWEGPWWEKALAVLGGLAAWLAAGLVASLVVAGLMLTLFAGEKRSRRRRLARLLRFVNEGRHDQARAMIDQLQPLTSMEVGFDANPELASRLAQAASSPGPLRLPLVRLLLAQAPHTAEVAATLRGALGELDSKDVRRWLWWVEGRHHRRPERDERLAAAIEEAFPLMADADRYFAWKDVLRWYGGTERFAALAAAYRADLERLAADDSLRPEERAALQRLRGAPAG